jgi:uncharacterized RDD family membrane protein YckC
MYCFKCGSAMPDGAAFCPTCGQGFSVAAAAPRAPMMNVPAAAPAYAAVPRVEYAGFWLRVLAYVIDNAVIAVGILVVLIPLIILTGLGGLLSRIRPPEGLEDAGFFLIIGLIFLAATVSLVVTWLYHALMESSEWQATVGKRVLGLVVTDMAGRRVSFGRSTGRHFGKIVTNMVPALIGYIMAGFTERKQALHDMMAGCLVLRRTS